MRTFIILTNEQREELPEEFQSDDVRFAESLVEYFLERYTNKGDKVLDIFAGFGTTLFVAEQMDRIPYGIEYDRKRFEYIQANLEHKSNIIHGDALKLLDYDLPKFDFCITSPPYMWKDDKENPFTAYTTEGNYKQYLIGIKTIYSHVKKIVREDSYIVIEVSNLKKDKEVTTLAWDIAIEVAKVLHFEGEIIVGWESKDGSKNDEGIYGYGYDHSYCLVFKNRR